jgi:hypothetical protein
MKAINKSISKFRKNEIAAVALKGSLAMTIATVFLFGQCAFGAEKKKENAAQAPAAQSRVAISDTKMAEAFENGSSLVFAKVLSVYSTESERRHQKIDYYYYTVKMKPIVAPDLMEKDFEEPIEISAGSDKVIPLKPNSTLAIFVSKDSLEGFYWVYRNDFAEVTNQNLKSLQETAKTVYAKTDIAKFREIKKTKVEMPQLPPELVSACEQFRNNPEKRSEYAETIYESKLGSRKEKNDQNQVQYSKPEIVLSRDQIVAMLGEPSLKFGWTYKWFCGQEDIPGMGNQVGILTVVFDKKYQDAYLIYTHEERLKWIK